MPGQVLERVPLALFSARAARRTFCPGPQVCWPCSSFARASGLPTSERNVRRRRACWMPLRQCRSRESRHSPRYRGRCQPPQAFRHCRRLHRLRHRSPQCPRCQLSRASQLSQVSQLSQASKRLREDSDCRRGGIGRHTVLRGRRRKLCEFESHRRHQCSETKGFLSDCDVWASPDFRGLKERPC